MPRPTFGVVSRLVSAGPLPFDHRLVVNQWILDLFEATTFDDLGGLLRDPSLEGFDVDNVSHFHHVLRARLVERQDLSGDVLLLYDENIVRHWTAIADVRARGDRRIYPKYFQYLALLFTEIYLDRYFRDSEKLVNSLNRQVDRFNQSVAATDRVSPYDAGQLKKLAYWCATGSGKTLLMHVNIQQYRHYLQLYGRENELSRVILLTPNEGLSQQHLTEFRLSGLAAELFVKDSGGLFASQQIEIIDIHKLKDDMGDKTVAVDAFEGNNLVLVDEGHRGAGGVDWLAKRNQLCEGGFSFEYSATFGQAMKAANKRELSQEYAKCILFDYSYKYFYRDGYGKDYLILNLDDDRQDDVRKLYLTACLLVFYQQTRIYLDQAIAFRPFLIEEPLWVFVGGSVNAVQSRAGRQVSDVIDVLLFLAEFVSRRDETIRYIDRLLKGRGGLLDPAGREIFANTFTYLISCGLSPNQVYEDVLDKVFNARSRAALHVENLKGSDGEIALRLGENEPFGVINVGDSASLHKLCRDYEQLVTTEREFSASLFQGINSSRSTIKLLVGSKKFTEGWNSWRVSTMGLMNIGKSEGPEIIQLFGRGVRLKGYDFSLKRSRHVEGVTPPQQIENLETLNIFGIHASYMRQFEDYLKDEGVPSNESRLELVLPVVRLDPLPKLKMLRLQDGIDFKRDGPKPTLGPRPREAPPSRVVVDWYPRIQAERSQGLRRPADVAIKNEATLTQDHLAFLDIDQLFFDLERFKNERAWYNLNLPRPSIRLLLGTPDWYRLLIPNEELAITSFGRVRLWQEIALALLQKYVEWYYRYHKSAYELPHLEYRDLTGLDSNFVAEYRFRIDESQTSVIETLKKIKAEIVAKRFRDGEFSTVLKVIAFDRHLYQPLVYLKSDLIEVKPVPLNDGERDFVLDLRSFYQGNRSFFDGKELYLLRNLSRGRGVGFFEAGNFYPDFILWLVVGEHQHVTFVDPKGIRNLSGQDDPKISFYLTIKELEKRLRDASVTLNSFILSNTPHREVGWWDGGMTIAEFESRNVLFQSEDRAGYIRKLLSVGPPR